MPENSYVEKLVTSLTDNSGASSPKSVVTDNLKFHEGTGKLHSESSTATTLVAKVLKAFGNARLKIVGYSDNVGDPEENKKKSLARANAVKDALVEAGAPGDRITVGLRTRRNWASRESSAESSTRASLSGRIRV